MSAVEGLNPSVLKWAREASGMSLGEVAQKLKRDATEVASWEMGESAPTYPQLERLAYNVLHRPVALFFLPNPPEEPTPEGSFRTMPDFAVEDLSADTRYHIRKARGFQLSLIELAGGHADADRLIFRDIQLTPGAGVVGAASTVREYLGLGPAFAVRLRNPSDKLKEYRDAIEAVGIFVFKNSIQQRGVSGFCLLDADYPVVYLNNSTSFTRQVFTLIHELGHLLLGTSGMTLEDDSFISVLAGDSRRIEIFCNAFAAEFLVPSADFGERIPTDPYDEGAVVTLASGYGVSREVILRRLLDRGLVEQAYYEQKAAEWIGDYRRIRAEGGGGGDYYRNQASYLGQAYMGLAFGEWYKGRISTEQLASHLNVRLPSISGLEDRLQTGGAD